MSLTISALNANLPREFMGRSYPSPVRMENRSTIEGDLNFNNANGPALLRLRYNPLDPSSTDMIPMAVVRRAYTMARSTFARKAPTVLAEINELRAFAFSVAVGSDDSGSGGARIIAGAPLELEGLAQKLEAFGAFIMEACDLGATHIGLS